MNARLRYWVTLKNGQTMRSCLLDQKVRVGNHVSIEDKPGESVPGTWWEVLYCSAQTMDYAGTNFCPLYKVSEIR